jgi:hypothetical protein
MIGPILGAIAEVLDGLQCKTPGVTQLKLLRAQTVLRRADAPLRANLTNHFDLRALADAAGTTARTLRRALPPPTG